MKLSYGPLIMLVVLLASCTREPVPAEQQFIDDVAAALGGKAAIESVNTFTMAAEGRMLNLGQDMTPESATFEFDISDYTMSADLANDRGRTELTRTPLFDYFLGRDPMRLISGIDGDVAYDISADGNARRAHDDVAEDRRATYYHHPLPLVRAALGGTATIGNLRSEAGLALADVTLRSGKTFTLAIDDSTKLPAYISSMDHHFYLRDILRRTEFSDYTAVGEMSLPAVITQSLDEFHPFQDRCDESDDEFGQ